VSLSVAVERYPELVKARLGTIVPAEDPFVARNEASWSGGAFVYIPACQRLTMPMPTPTDEPRSGS
jgi:Fe-S cluster assembly protein SufB